jgi:hypothetical protein
MRASIDSATGVVAGVVLGVVAWAGLCRLTRKVYQRFA